MAAMMDQSSTPIWRMILTLTHTLKATKINDIPTRTPQIARICGPLFWSGGDEVVSPAAAMLKSIAVYTCGVLRSIPKSLSAAAGNDHRVLAEGKRGYVLIATTTQRQW
jgi:hypothetical protein